MTERSHCNTKSHCYILYTVVPQFHCLGILPKYLTAQVYLGTLRYAQVYFPNAKEAEFQYVTVPNLLLSIKPLGQILYMLR